MSTPDNEKRPLGFVNRRGHNQGDISASELADLSIDDQPVVTSIDAADMTKDVAPESKAKTDSKTTKKPRKERKVPVNTKPIRRKRSFSWSRKKTLILAGVILVVIAIPIVSGEILRAQYLASTNSAKQAVSALSAETIAMQKKDEYNSKQLRALTEKLEGIRDDMCPGALLDNIALLYPRADEAHDTCIAQRTKIAGLETAQRDMVNMFAYIESVNAVLARVGTPDGDAYAVVATQQSNWQSAQDELKKLNAPTELKAAHEQLVVAVASITDGWSKLNVASNDQNAANFQAAEEQLAKGYDAVRATKATFVEAVNAKQGSITIAARSLS